MHIPFSVTHMLRLALDEDLGNGDLTTNLLIPEEQESRALIIAKGSFIVAGMPFMREVFALGDRTTEFTIFCEEGEKIKKGAIIAELHGNTGTLLSCERVGLNVLQRLSGVATLTNAFVNEVKGTGAVIVDTRKTTPGMRFMERYAVRVGGGSNHRFGLYDGILIKDNHIEAVGSITTAVRAARKAHHLLRTEVEVETLNELMEALAAGSDVVMLDNMSLEDMKEAVKRSGGKVIIEASGNITIERVRAVAETGVDFISIGALTHSAPAADISMKIVKH